MTGYVPRSVVIGLWLTLATAVVSGASTFVNSYAVAGTNSDGFVTARNALVALLIAPAAVATARSQGDRLRPLDWGRLATIGLVGGAIPFLLFFHGLQLATAGGGGVTASFLYRTLFLWAGALGVVALGERPTRRMALAAGLLLAGNVLLLALTAPVWTDGSLYVLAATVLWAAEYTLSKRTLRDLSSGTVALGRMGFGAVFLLAYVAVVGEAGTVLSFHPAQWRWLGVSAALLAAFVGTWYAGLKRVELGVASAVLVLGFPITVLLSTVVRGTPTPAVAVLGGILVVVGAAAAIGTEYLRAIARGLGAGPPASASR